MVKEKTFVIDGERYTIRQLGAKQGRRVWFKLVQAMAAPIKTLGEMPKLDEKAIAAALGTAIASLDEDMIDSLYETFGETCTVAVGERQPTLNGVVFDQHFAGKYVQLSQWLWQCVSFNFLDFLDESSLGNLFARGRAVMDKLPKGEKNEKESQSPPKDSTGPSGDS